jgi:hypothetical protein
MVYMMESEFTESYREWNPAEGKWEWYTREIPMPESGEGWSFTPAEDA